VPQFRARIDAELFGEAVPRAVVVRQGVGLAATAVQREQELPGQPFVQGMLGGQRGQPGEERGVLAQAKARLVVLQLGGEALGVERGAQRGGPRGVHAGQRLLPPPPAKSPLVPLDRLALVLAGARLGQQAAEAVQIDGRLVRHQDVAGALAPDGAVGCRAGERDAQPGEIAAQRRPHAVGLLLAPDAVGELVERDGAVRVGQQRGQHPLLFRRPQVERPAVHTRRDRPQ
jgi:hypothetical protein